MDTYSALPENGASTTRTGVRGRRVSLIDERFDHDSCGVGFVASVEAVSSHTILEQALTGLGRLAHRGAVAADGRSSDGVGLMTAVPRELLLDAMGLQLDKRQALGVGMLFLPEAESRAEAGLEQCLTAQGMKAMAWRDVPVRPECLGEIALSTMPRVRQVLIQDISGRNAGTMERRLYLARKHFERMFEQWEVLSLIHI